MIGNGRVGNIVRKQRDPFDEDEGRTIDADDDVDTDAVIGFNQVCTGGSPEQDCTAKCGS